VLFVKVPKKEVSQPWDQMNLWEITELVRYLQNAPAADATRVASLEWGLLPLTRGGRSIPRRFTPKFLHREISNNPAFFAEVLSIATAHALKAEERKNAMKQMRRTTYSTMQCAI